MAPFCETSSFDRIGGVFRMYTLWATSSFEVLISHLVTSIAGIIVIIVILPYSKGNCKKKKKIEAYLFLPENFIAGPRYATCRDVIMLVAPSSVYYGR